MMSSRNTCNFLVLVGSVIVLTVSADAFQSMAYAQTAKQMVGTWQLVSSINTVNGKQVKPFGDKPLGLAAFTADGHFFRF